MNFDFIKGRIKNIDIKIANCFNKLPPDTNEKSKGYYFRFRKYSRINYIKKKFSVDPGDDFYQQKRDLFLEIIAASRFESVPCKGTYFQLLNYSKISKISDNEMAENLIKINGVASIPVSGFSFSKIDEKNLRFCFAKKEETLKRAGDILIKI